MSACVRHEAERREPGAGDEEAKVRREGVVSEVRARGVVYESGGDVSSIACQVGAQVWPLVSLNTRSHLDLPPLTSA